MRLEFYPIAQNCSMFVQHCWHKLGPTFTTLSSNISFTDLIFPCNSLCTYMCCSTRRQNVLMTINASCIGSVLVTKQAKSEVLSLCHFSAD